MRLLQCLAGLAVVLLGIAQAGAGEKATAGDPLPAGAIARLGSSRLRHSGAKNVQFVSGKNAILTGSASDGFVRLWDAKTGQELGRFPGERFHVEAKGKTLVTWDTAFHVWDLTTGKEFASSPIGTTEGYWDIHVAVSPDGRLVVAGDLGDHIGGVNFTAKVETWDLKTGKRVGSWIEKKRNGFPGIHLSPDGRIVNFFGAGGKETATGKLIYNWASHSATVFSPDSQTVILGMMPNPNRADLLDHVAKDIASGKERFRIPNGSCAIYSEDGKRVMVMGWKRQPGEGKLRFHVLDAATGKTLCELKEIVIGDWQNPVFRDGKFLVTSDYGHIYVWDVDTGAKVREIDCPLTQYSRIDISPDGTTLAVAVSPGVRLWDIATGKRLVHEKAHDTAPVSLAFAPDGKTLASMDLEAVTRVWDVRAGKQVDEFQPVPSERRTGLDLPDKYPLQSPLLFLGQEKKWLAIGQPIGVWGSAMESSHSMVHIADLAARKHLRSLGSHGSPVGAHVVSADGTIVVGTAGTSFRSWNVATGKERSTQMTLPETGKEQINKFGPPPPPRLAMSPDGRLLAAYFFRMQADARLDSVLVWEMASGVVRHRSEWQVRPSGFAQFGRGTNPIYTELKTLEFSPDNRTLALGDKNNIRLWDLEKQKEVRRVGGPTLVEGAAFSPDGKVLAALTTDGEICLWDVATGTILHSLKSPARFTCFRFAPFGTMLATGSDDANVLLWDLNKVVKAVSPRAADPLDILWSDLASADGAKAGKAMLALRGQGSASVAFFRRHARPIVPADPKLLKQLVADLESERFAVRDKARRDLQKLGDLAVAVLRQGSETKRSLEGKRRIEELLDTLESLAQEPELLRLLRAIEVLEKIGSPEARAVLEDLATGMPHHRVTQAARESIQRLLRGVE